MLDRIDNRIYGNDMFDGVLRGILECPGTVYFIAEEISDVGFIMKQALQLLQEGCQSFCVYGQYADLWMRIIDETDILMNPKANYETKIQIQCCESLDEFMDKLMIEKECSEGEECCIIYDNREVYLKIIEMFNTSLVTE